MVQSDNDKSRHNDSEKRMMSLESYLVEAIVQAEALRVREQLPESGRALEQLLDDIQLYR